MFCFLLSSRIYSAVRIDNARIVHVAFLSDCCTWFAPSTTKTFLQSWAWHHLLSPDFFNIISHPGCTHFMDDSPWSFQSPHVMIAMRCRSSYSTHLVND